MSGKGHKKQQDHEGIWVSEEIAYLYHMYPHRVQYAHTHTHTHTQNSLNKNTVTHRHMVKHHEEKITM